MRIYFPRVIAWLSLLVLAVGCAALLASCAHPNQAPPPQSEPIGADAVPPDTTHALAPVPTTLPTIVVEPHRSLLDKVFGRTPASATYPAGTTVKAGKKNTINNFYGAATQYNNTAGKNAAAGAGATGGKADGPVAGAGAELTNIEKAKAPVATGAGDATDNTKQAQRGGAAASGDGATATATTEKKTLWAALLPGLGLLAGIGTVYWLAAGGGAMWLAALWRKNKPNPNQA